MPLFESETLRGYQYHQQNQTKNYVTIIIEIKEILKNVIAPYLEKEKKTTKNCISWVTVWYLSDSVWNEKALSDKFGNSVFQNRIAKSYHMPPAGI